MTAFSEGARVRVGKCLGTVQPLRPFLLVRLDGQAPSLFPAEFVELVGPVSGSTGQQAEQDPVPVADSELRATVAMILHDLECGCTDRDLPLHDHQNRARWFAAADDVMAVVAPVLAANERKYDDRLQAMKNECDQVVAEAVVEVDASEASFRYIRLQLAEMVDADEETEIPELLGNVKAELDLRWATRQQYAEERDAARAVAATHLFDGEALSTREAIRTELITQGAKSAAQLVGVQREVERERAERNRLQTQLGEAVTALAKIADREQWEYPPSLLDRVELVAERLREARAERDELRAHGVARDIGEANEQLRAELDALKAKASTKWQWMTAPISDVQHLVPEGDGVRVSLCDDTGSTRWREPQAGDEFCAVCTFGGDGTEASEQAGPKVWVMDHPSDFPPDALKHLPVVSAVCCGDESCSDACECDDHGCVSGSASTAEGGAP